MNFPDDEQADPFTLAEEERADLQDLIIRIIDRKPLAGAELIAYVTELASTYRAQGYVMGDLAHDGTLRLQAEAEAEADDEYEFHQCPHEVIRATCGRGGCTCPCDPCAPSRAPEAEQ